MKKRIIFMFMAIVLLCSCNIEEQYNLEPKIYKNTSKIQGSMECENGYNFFIMYFHNDDKISFITEKTNGKFEVKKHSKYRLSSIKDNLYDKLIIENNSFLSGEFNIENMKIIKDSEGGDTIYPDSFGEFDLVKDNQKISCRLKQIPK